MFLFRKLKKAQDLGDKKSSANLLLNLKNRKEIVKTYTFAVGLASIAKQEATNVTKKIARNIGSPNLPI